MNPKLKYCTAIFILFIIGCQDEELVSPILKNYTTDFDSVWFKYDQKYPLFEYKNINWDNISQQYRNRFVSISIESRNELLTEILTIFKDPHIIITPTTGTVISPYVNHSIENNFNAVFINNYLDSILFRKVNDYWGWSIINNVGYFRIKSLSSSNFDTLTFSSIMDSLKTTDGIIIDIREEYGGELPVCEHIWNKFAPIKQTVGYQQYRDGPLHNDFAPLIPVYAMPNYGDQYLNNTVVLIGGYCVSAGEIFANSLSYFSQVTLVGDTTMGAVEATSTFNLPDGTKYTVPIVAYLDIYHHPLEWRGVPPDIYIDPKLIRNNTQKDLAIEKAFEIIQSRTHITCVASGMLQ